MFAIRRSGGGRLEEIVSVRRAGAFVAPSLEPNCVSA